jgi:hypothetical protein
MGRERKDRLADKNKGPVTTAVRVLRDKRVAFSEHAYAYVDRGGTAEGSRQLGLDEHSLAKTLIMEDELKKPFIVLTNEDKRGYPVGIGPKELLRVLNPILVKVAV